MNMFRSTFRIVFALSAVALLAAIPGLVATATVENTNTNTNTNTNINTNTNTNTVENTFIGEHTFIQGYKISEGGSIFNNPGATITVSGFNFNQSYGTSVNPYTTGAIPAGIYTITSSVPSGYIVSYATCTNCTNEEFAQKPYVNGSSFTVHAPSGGYVNLWWKYSPIVTPPPPPPSPTLGVVLTASPSTGTVPLPVTLTGRVSGTAVGPIHYYFWWDCADPTTNAAGAEAACGALPTPSPGNCIAGGYGLHCNAIPDTAYSTFPTYTTAGTKTAKVIVERGTASPAQAQQKVTVNSPSPVPPPPPAVLINNAACLAVSAPADVTAGREFSAAVTMQNIGTKTWTADSTPHKLGSQNPQDNIRWGLTRVGLPGGISIFPWQTVTFSFVARAPSVPGSYSFNWRMLEESVQRFGETCQETITVTAVTPPPQIGRAHV